jgi:DHA3 family macrolide efflux protein-like MFS transporter
VGNRIVQFALVWWITATTGSAAALASATLFVVLPQIVLGPFMGILVDRWDRRRVMIWMDLITIVASSALAYVSFIGRLSIWHIYALVIVRSTAEQFTWTALQSSTSLMVPEKHLARVAGINQTIQGGLNIAAPALGALLVSLLPLHGIIPVQVAFAAIAIAILAFSRIPRPEPAARAESQASSFLGELAEGFRFLRSWKGMFVMICTFSVGNLVGNATSSLVPLFVRNHLGGGAPELGMLESAMGVGIIVGGLAMGVWGGFQRRIYTAILGLLIAAAGQLVVGLSPAGAIVMALAGWLISGFANAFINAPFMAILQSAIPPRLQGRVFTVVMSINMAATPIGLALAAPVADHLGIRAWFLLSPAVLVIISAVMRFVPSVRHLEDSRIEEVPAAVAAQVLNKAA